MRTTSTTNVLRTMLGLSTVALLAASGCIGSSDDAGTGDELRVCPAEDCGALGMPSYTCPDGSTGGPTGRCVLQPGASACGWEIRECPPTSCGPMDCGPAPGAAIRCDDGTTSVFECRENAEGTCSWQRDECPSTGALTWYRTCGDPVCSGYTPRAGATPCTTETAGDPCSSAGATCDPMDSCNAQLVCASTDPTMQPGGCPISRARFKTDVRYLERDDVEHYSDELMQLRLATYRYVAAPERSHLGFIIEDVEPSASVDSPRDMVDLYGYTSMAVAALQTQARQIDALRAEVAALRAQTGTSAAMCID